MKKSILLTSLIVVLCLSVLFTAPADASDGGEINIDSNSEKTVDYFIFLPLVVRETGSPKLVSPANGSTLNTLIPDFVWEEMKIPTDHSVRIEMSENIDFSPISEQAIPASSTSAELYWNLKPDTKYFWRAFLYSWTDQIRHNYSEVWTFTTPNDAVLPEAPVLKSPTNEEVISAGPIVLEVNEVPGATGYQFWYRESGGTSYYIDNSDSSQFTIPGYFPLTPGGNYEWWVKTINQYGYGDTSLSRTFSLSNSFTADNSAKVDQNHHFLIYNEETNTFTQR